MALLQTNEDKEFAAKVKSIARSLAKQESLAEYKAIYDLTMQLVVSGKAENVKQGYTMAVDMMNEFKKVDTEMYQELFE